MTHAFPIWKKITLPEMPTDTFYQSMRVREALKEAGCKTSSHAGDLIRSGYLMSDWSKENEITLVKTSVEDLGFEQKTTLDDLYKKALEMNLKLCPALVGPQLRLSYMDQPKGETLYIAMKPIVDHIADYRIFDINNPIDDEFLWLGAYFFRGANCFLRPKATMVFCI